MNKTIEYKIFRFKKGEFLDDSIFEFWDKKLTNCESIKPGTLPRTTHNWRVSIIIENIDDGEIFIKKIK